MVRRYIHTSKLLDDYDRKHILKHYTYSEMIIVQEELALYKAFEMRTHQKNQAQGNEEAI